MTNDRIIQMSDLIALALTGLKMPVERTGNVIEVEDTEGRLYTVTVEAKYVLTDTSPLPVLDGPVTDSAGYLPCGCHGSQRDHSCGPSESDDDGDDDERADDPAEFDGGFGRGSYFDNAMRKDD